MSYVEKIQPIIDDEAEKLKRLLKVKAAGYGPSWQMASDVLKHLFPKGIPTDAYEDVLLIVRVIDKLSRLATSLSSGMPDAGGESPWQDIAGYGIVAIAKERYKSLGNDKVPPTKAGLGLGIAGSEM